MLRPRQARSIGGQKNVTLNELLQIHDEKITTEDIASQHLANFCKEIGNFCQSPHTPARPRPSSLARSAFLQSIPGTIPAKPLLPLAKIALGMLGMEVVAFCQHLPTWYFVPELVLELVTPVLELVTSSGQFWPVLEPVLELVTNHTPTRC